MQTCRLAAFVPPEQQASRTPKFGASCREAAKAGEDLAQFVHQRTDFLPTVGQSATVARLRQAASAVASGLAAAAAQTSGEARRQSLSDSCRALNCLRSTGYLVYCAGGFSDAQYAILRSLSTATAQRLAELARRAPSE